MVSRRRAARAGLDRPANGADGVPAWIWGDEVRPRNWARDHGWSFDGRHEALVVWRERCREWLEERGLVMYGVNASYEDFKRIEREEPHRVLRRSDKNAAAEGRTIDVVLRDD